MTADDVIRALNLQPHPVEGGYFRETYRSTAMLPNPAGSRSLSTAIYYLLKPDHVSELHVLPADEVYHFYMGSPLKMLQLWPDGSGREVILGTDIAAEQVPQLVVPAGVWQGSRLLGSEGFALVGCTVAPGFEDADYRGGSRPELTAKWLDFAEEIARLTPRG